MRSSLLQAAILAGASLVGQTAAMAQDYPAPPGHAYLNDGAAELCPPLVAPSPYPTPTEPVPEATDPAAPSQDQQASPPMGIDDFPPASDLSPFGDPSVQQPLAAMPAAGVSLAAASSPQSVAPNMIGDFFGVSGRRSLVSLQTDSFHFAGSYRSSSTGELLFFPATQDTLTGFIDLTAPTALAVRGDVTTVIPSGTTWTSATSQSPLPPSFALAENSVETMATSAAFPAASSVSFVEGVATQNPSDSSEYSIFTDYLIFQPSEIMTVVIPDPGSAPGAFVGRQKISENTSPIPRSRVFVNYSFFNSTPLTEDGVDVSRLTPGFEYAFFNDNLSIEVRAPFASTLDSDLDFSGRTSTSEIEMGNVTAYVKALMWESDTFSWSAGVGATMPTADDVELEFDGVTALRIENEAIHVLPFLGFLWTPRERLFVQGFFQLDIDTNGNPVEFSSFNEGLPDGNLQRIGRADDSTYAFVDLGIGYWMYRNRRCTGLINGLAPTVELHYNAATEGADTITRNDFAGMGANVQVGSPGDLEVTNLVLGLTSLLGDSGTLTLGYATPVAGDDQFDGEFRAFLNWYFGPRGY